MAIPENKLQCRRKSEGLKKEKELELGFHLCHQKTTMIYDVNSPLFRSFLSQKGGSSDKRKADEQKPKEQKPKASENKPIMTE
ncbi:hypothetical protein VNO78_15988 [Psophocarpus tetragonolobus]|uniref:Wound-induced basic protein n=1 Tax=Psophocarpus tetragonolobus TaxID=3891 RepID=A0AAN9XK32_PSOTE